VRVVEGWKIGCKLLIAYCFMLTAQINIATRFYYCLTFFSACPLFSAMLTDLEKQVIASVQGDLPVTSHPYSEIADRLEVSESVVLQTLQDLCERGVIRRFGATIRHQRSGFKANAMVAWRVDEKRVEEVGKIFAAFAEVSHCYRRNPADKWPYNLYTMVHANDETACRSIARVMSEKAHVKEYTLLFSRKELKKTSMAYFADDDE
jgi:DNA-binding Lrp family transcriptional regulator